MSISECRIGKQKLFALANTPQKLCLALFGYQPIYFFAEAFLNDLQCISQKKTMILRICTTLVIFSVSMSYMPHQYIVDMGYEPFRFIHWNCQAIPKSVLQYKGENDVIQKK